MANVIVIGSQWGDEGKGKIVDIYTEFADAIVRFQGGSNAGHTVVIGNKKIILHQIPSGILHPEKLCIIGNGVVLDLETLLDEINELKSHGFFQDETQLLISEAAHLVFPYHRLIDMGKENKAGSNKIGTTGRGIGPAYGDKIVRAGIRVIDLFDEGIFREKLEKNAVEKNFYLTKHLNQEGFDRDALFEKYSALARRLKANVVNTAVAINHLIEKKKNILFEGAQGTLLDVDHGTYPFVTSSNTVAGAACVGSGVGPTKIDGVVGVVKAYTTRVGEGPFPTEVKDEIGLKLREKGGEFGATTGRPRRCGWIDIVALKHANRINGFTHLALTKLDVLTGVKKIKVCRAYKSEGKEVSEFPASIHTLKNCEPVYEEVAGWQEDLTDIKKYNDLPKNAKNYIKLLEKLTKRKFILISVGVERGETIMLRTPFLSKK
ncbi:MAG TPA: adenylosuccinate synthase [Thermodesulfobacteriota bacterium]|nr:adenylosuccinate synthase [Thermodesulfobacteriota bacterium]